MDLHANAALSWSGRRELARRVVEEGRTVRAAADASGVSVRCARKWVRRFRAGDQQLRDRSSAPRTVANRTPADRVAVIERLRRLRMTAAHGRASSSISTSGSSAASHAAGKRVGFRTTDAGRYRRCDRDGHERGTSGWYFVHVAVDDYSRLAYAEVLSDEKASTAVAFLRRALALFAR